MCGIAGIFGRQDSDTLRTMLGSMAHRGPDDEHYVAGDHFCLGARRLSIVDIQGGRQPISNESGEIWVAQNGEIYNFCDLQKELIARGHNFSTRCDTEALVHLYEDRGEGFAKYLNGMFAVAIWDGPGRVGILARDRMGKKPLYYLVRDQSMYFASEIKALLTLPHIRKELNLEALHHYLSYKHVPCPLSIFQGIHMLPPGHLLLFRPGRAPQVRQYWSVDFSSPLEGEELREENLVTTLLDLLREGVRRRLMGDVPVGFFLSGGIDSCLSTALAAEVSPVRVKTFTLTYGKQSATPGKSLDRDYARLISHIYDTEHHEEVIESADLPESLPAIISHFDEPFSGVFSTFFLSKVIGRHVKVAVSGDAADELFGSYLSHRLAFPIHDYLRAKESGGNGLEKLLPFEGRPGFLERLAEHEQWKWRYKLLVFTDDEKHRLYSPDVGEAMAQYSTLDHLRGYFANLTAKDPLNRILEAEFRSFFPDQVLTYIDRLSMAHSLEVRTAFLDPDVVSYVARIPGRFKIRDGQTKYILKKAALKYLPQEVVFRQKEGFLMPITDWILHDLEDYVRGILSSGNLSKHNLFRLDYVNHLVDQLYTTDSDYTHVNKVLSLIVFQEWYNLYMS